MKMVALCNVAVKQNEVQPKQYIHLRKMKSLLGLDTAFDNLHQNLRRKNHNEEIE